MLAALTENKSMCQADTSGVAQEKSKYVNEAVLFQHSCNSFLSEWSLFQV